MCDYSLMVFRNRLARDGEELVMYRFPGGSMGLASPDEVGNTAKKGPRRTLLQALRAAFILAEECTITAVCIPPASRLTVYEISEPLQKRLGVGPEEEARFEQLSDAVDSYRDAIAFRNGQMLTLQELPVGQRMRVLDLGGGGESDAEEGEMVEFPGFVRAERARDIQ